VSEWKVTESRNQVESCWYLRVWSSSWTLLHQD